jgi:hypothetical protein
VQVSLTSHFAGNKVTLFDFQLAEKMNWESKVTSKLFSKYTYFEQSTKTSLIVFFLTAFVGINVLRIGVSWGNFYPSSALRGGKPQ